LYQTVVLNINEGPRKNLPRNESGLITAHYKEQENYIFVLENSESVLENKTLVSAAPNVPRITDINIHSFSSGFKCGVVDLAPEAKVKNPSRPPNAFIIYRRKKTARTYG
ncbi:15606_t:CDS:2, partial [Gigaspora margarita]